MKSAAAQFTSVPGDIEGNVRTMATLIREAAGQGARVVAFAELAVTGYELGLIAKDPGLTLTQDDPRLGPLREACRAGSIAAVVGCAVRTESGRPAITALVIGPDGGLLARYDKVHLHGEENDIFAAGTEQGRFTLDGVGFALAICYDNRFPEVAERARADGCQVYVAGSVHERENDSFEVIYPVRARDNGLFVVLANAVGLNEVGDCRGNSAVWGPDGTLLATAGEAAPGLALAEVAIS
ncbi:carbon-nitrogen hydrolase family protein [Streptomyces sp. NPDC002889]|uniref:carbon-nitrogen hydrolase family protein n=1 Tax=Streptomyces sp. NPDC002889 TaxID=3364669 RepID=UPI0036971771